MSDKSITYVNTATNEVFVSSNGEPIKFATSSEEQKIVTLEEFIAAAPVAVKEEKKAAKKKAVAEESKEIDVSTPVVE